MLWLPSSRAVWPCRHSIAPMAFSSAVLPQASVLMISHHILSGLAVTALHGLCWQLPVHTSAHGQESKACPYNLNSVKIHHKSDVQCSHTTPPAARCDGAACPNLSEHTAGPARATECSWESRRESVLLNHFHSELPSLGAFPTQHHFQDSAITKTHFSGWQYWHKSWALPAPALHGQRAGGRKYSFCLTGSKRSCLWF